MRTPPRPLLDSSHTQSACHDPAGTRGNQAQVATYVSAFAHVDFFGLSLVHTAEQNSAEVSAWCHKLPVVSNSWSSATHSHAYSGACSGNDQACLADH
jgi:hypothetical protein